MSRRCRSGHRTAAPRAPAAVNLAALGHVPAGGASRPAGGQCSRRSIPAAAIIWHVANNLDHLPPAGRPAYRGRAGPTIRGRIQIAPLCALPTMVRLRLATIPNGGYARADGNQRL